MNDEFTSQVYNEPKFDVELPEEGSDRMSVYTLNGLISISMRGFILKLQTLKTAKR